MRYAVYVKGERGFYSLKGLLARKLIPVVCVGEERERAIAKLCKKSKIPYIIEKSPGTKAHIVVTNKRKLDLLVCAGYSRILPEELFLSLRYGAINCHGGRLPQYRGASPIPWQIINGETYGIAYVIKMTKDIDNGPMLAQERYEIKENDTARNITDKVTKIFYRIVPKVVKLYASDNPPKGAPQDERDACRWTRRYPDDGIIAWNRLTAKQVVNLIRALDDPYPGAFLLRKKEKVVIRRARVFDKLVMGIPGRFIGRTSHGALILATDGAVEVLEFAYKGKHFPGNEFPGRYGETY